MDEPHGAPVINPDPVAPAAAFCAGGVASERTEMCAPANWWYGATPLLRAKRKALWCHGHAAPSTGLPALALSAAIISSMVRDGPADDRHARPTQRSIGATCGSWKVAAASHA